MKNWEKEFDEKFLNRIKEYCDYSNDNIFMIFYDEIKSFISSLLISQRKEVIEEVIKEIKFEYGDYAKIDDLITRLNKLK